MGKHVVSFCFDDGFRASSVRTRALFEERDLTATFCVMAQPSWSMDPYHRGMDFADWAFWRECCAAGHDVAPHGLAHERLQSLDPALAQAGLEEMFGIFQTELPNFIPNNCVFHAAYMAMPPAVFDWLRPQVRAIRLFAGNGGVNEPAAVRHSGRLDCIAFGPDNVALSLRSRLVKFLDAPPSWLVVVLHGLDNEGWGAINSGELAGMIDMLLTAGVDIVPVGRALR